VHFVGRVPPDLVPYYYKLADVTVDPVNNDDAAKGRCPLKMFESWVMNTPFVTADVGDRRILAGEYYIYTLARPGDHLDLAKKILMILDNQDLASQLSRAYRCSVENYFWDKIVINQQHIFD
jgi:glycosyltransferase involved in cell wall biosynthesis